MEPKEKAQELIAQFSYAMRPVPVNKHAKQCALICVREIINSIYDAQGNNDLLITYWETVIDEINKL